uniref:PHD-type domain-containing protein n=2 Tax=Paramormyrops kingsleyae TaxID=1676925 RepID=A0A3B3SNC7_9TELE
MYKSIIVHKIESRHVSIDEKRLKRNQRGALERSNRNHDRKRGSKGFAYRCPSNFAMKRRQHFCDFCHLSEENRKTGPLIKRNALVVHENCLLYSSGIYSKNTSDVDDLCGIDEQDVIKEIKRGRKLKCYKCKENGATIGCEVQKCKKSYHYLCALDDGAQPIEDIPNGVFRIFCSAHRPSPDKKGPGTSDAEELERGDQIEDSEEIPSKRTKMSTRNSRAKRRSGQLDSSDSSCSGGRQERPSEQGQVETDSEDGANPGQNVRKKNLTVAAEADNNSDDDLDCTQLDRNADADEPRPSTSGNQVTSNGKFNDTDSEQGSESLLLPIKITGVQSLCPSIPGCSHNTKVSSVESSFWAKCQEAGCIESVFSTFISSMKELSERMVSKQASKEDCILSFKVLKASGMLPDILAQIEQDMNGKLKILQEETKSLQTALSAIGSARNVQ